MQYYSFFFFIFLIKPNERFYIRNYRKYTVHFMFVILIKKKGKIKEEKRKKNHQEIAYFLQNANGKKITQMLSLSVNKKKNSRLIRAPSCFISTIIIVQQLLLFSNYNRSESFLREVTIYTV